MRINKMSKKILLIVTIGLIIIIILGFLLLIFGLCKRGLNEKLVSPTYLQINNEVLSWSEVNNADSYIVDINGEEYETSTTKLDIFQFIIEPDIYTIKVRAINKAKKLKSEYSQSIEYELKKTEGLSFKYINAEETEYMVYSEQKNLLEGKIVIPAEHNGVPVTQLKEAAFDGCHKITGIVLPNTIKDIGEAAFMDCIGLKRTNLPNNLKEIEDNLFDGCSLLQRIEIPKTVKMIGKHSFRNCNALTKLILPEGLEEINGSFESCSNLSELIIPQNVQQISYDSFWDCDSLTLMVDENNTTYKIDNNCLMRKKDNALILCLKNAMIPEYTKKIEESSMVEFEGESITIPLTVESISGNAFNGCPNIIEIYVENGNSIYKSEGNCIIRKEDNALIVGCKKSIIPNYVTRIGKDAFNSCKGLTIISIPATVTVIEDSAFYNCSDLEKVNFSFGLTSIGKNAFGYCRLKHISFPSSVKTIGASAFGWGGNKNFTSVVVIPKSVINIESCAFENSMIYMESRDILDTWYSEASVMDTEWWNSATCAMFKGCELQYENDVPYVSSFTYHFSIEEDGYCSIVGATELIRYPRVPYREGHVFGGWNVLVNGSYEKYEVTERNNDKVAFLSHEQAKVESGTIMYPIWLAE